MKKLVLLSLFAIMLTSCSEQEMARNFGGKATIKLKPTQRLVSVSWKEADLWVLTKTDTTKPTTYTLKQSASYGTMEGEVSIVEQ